MAKPLPLELALLQSQIEEVARSYGLDFFTSCYEMLDYDEINMVASYMGFPVRYPHWKWGMEYERLSKSYSYGLSKIYEMVINNDPCYAYLLESNAFVDQKIVMCHVTAHNDFFKNNYAFKHTNRRMIDDMANHATRIRRYMDWYGVDKVESFVDQVLSLDNLIDLHAPHMGKIHKEKVPDDELVGTAVSGIKRIHSDKEYMERYVNPEEYLEEQKKRLKEQSKSAKKFPKDPERDVLRFLIEHAPLNRWQRDVMEILRDEAHYFAPQAMTKIMNEGWASYWHAKLMTEKVMEPSEVIDYADRHSSVVASSPKQLNPYKLGIMLYRDIEERWNKGQFGLEWDDCNDMSARRAWDKNLGLGAEKIFQVRSIYNDVTFLDEFFTEEFCKRYGFFTYGYDKKKHEHVIESKNFQQVKKKLLSQITNMGQPIIKVTDGNFENRSELLLEHSFEGAELDTGYTKQTLKNLQAVWTRPVHILTHSEEKPVLYSFDGENFRERTMTK